MKNKEVSDLLDFVRENNFTILRYKIGGGVKEIPAKASLTDVYGGCYDAEYNYDTSCWSCVLENLEKALCKSTLKRPTFQLGKDCLPDWFCDKITSKEITLMNDHPSGRGLDTVWAIWNTDRKVVINNKDIVILESDGSLTIETN